MILYLHGFTSGPQSHKAQALGKRMQERGLGDKFLSPQLPAAPRDAIALAEHLIAAGGKRLRPLLTVAAARLAQGLPVQPRSLFGDF